MAHVLTASLLLPPAGARVLAGIEEEGAEGVNGDSGRVSHCFECPLQTRGSPPTLSCCSSSAMHSDEINVLFKSASNVLYCIVLYCSGSQTLFW